MRRVILTVLLALATCGIGILMVMSARTPDSLRSVEQDHIARGGVIVVGGAIRAPFRPDRWDRSFSGLGVINRGTGDIRLRRVSVIEKDEGIRVLGWRVFRASDNGGTGFVAPCGFPPKGWTTHPVEGFRVGAGEEITLVLGLASPTEPKRMTVKRVRVEYSTPSGTVTREVDHVVGFRAKRSVPCSEMSHGP